MQNSGDHTWPFMKPLLMYVFFKEHYIVLKYCKLCSLLIHMDKKNFLTFKADLQA